MERNKYKIGIIEDNKEEANLLIALLSNFEKENNLSFDVLSFQNPNIFIEKYTFQYDILFVDIDLTSSIDGIELSHRIRNIDKDVVIIFISNLGKLANKGYEVDAINFLIKPVNYEQIKITLKKAIRILESKDIKYIFVYTNNNLRKININDILYVEVVTHSIKLHLTNEVIETNGTLKEIEKKINSDTFERCNYCYLVNFKYIDGISKYECLIGKEKLQISHPRRKEFIKKFMDYLMRNNN